MTPLEEQQEYLDSITKKLGLVIATIASTLVILGATIVVLLKLNWEFAAAIGLTIGVAAAQLHNWLLEKIAYKYGYDLEYSIIENLYKKDQAPQKKTQVVVYIEDPEVKKDPWIHG